jgi:hypothetical protein
MRRNQRTTTKIEEFRLREKKQNGKKRRSSNSGQ